MGNLIFESATDENRETNYKDAGLSFVDAHNIAKQTGDSANERIADGCLRRLFEKWPEGKKQFPGIDEARIQA